ncbi:MAG TPA: MFS transporter, partial [Pseudolysinimonas sp.]|nr:MFS transporter [Pseudolysinimonas sp.]
MSSLAVLRSPQFRRGFLATSVSALGNNVATVAVAFAILSTRHSAIDLGIVLAARLVPLAVLSVLGGAWADRLPRRSVMVGSDLIRLVTQGGFAIVLLFPDPSLIAIVALQFVNGAATAFFQPAASGLVQEIVPPEQRQSAWALLSASNNISSIIGPAIGAALIALAGNAWALGVDALSFGLSALFLIGLVVPARVPDARAGLLREIGEGIREVTRRRWVGLEILSFSLFQFFPLAAYG